MRTNKPASRTKIKFKLLGTRVNIFSKKMEEVRDWRPSLD
jgi:hypothetical protein